MHAWGCACFGCAHARAMGALDPTALQQGIQTTAEIASAILAARAQRKAQEAAASAPTWSTAALPAASVAPPPVAAPTPRTTIAPLAIFAGGLLTVLAGGAFLLRSRRGR